MNRNEILTYLKEYDGRTVSIMEVCGTHTASIFKNAIPSLLSPKIRLVSGPGCPVCVTPAAFIDACIGYAMREGHQLFTFGDMMKVPGTSGSLSEAKGKGARVNLMYSPAQVVEKAAQNPETQYVIAAVGFETTAPAYALALEEAAARGLRNLKLAVALKTTLPALSWICENQEAIDGFLCPGHVSVITGSQVYEPLAETYKKPFVVAGFEGEHILAGIYEILQQIEGGRGCCRNLYPNAVKREGNKKALTLMERFFRPGPAYWRGLGAIADSGLYLRPEFADYDCGEEVAPTEDRLPPGCRCGDVITGRIAPRDCPLFATACTPMDPKGPCMVSAEGACGIWYRFNPSKAGPG